MKPESRSVLAVIVMALGAWTPNSRATVIDFDDVPGTGLRPISRDRYLSSGVHFAMDYVRVNGPSTSTSTPPNWLRNDTGEVFFVFMVPGTRNRGVTNSVSFCLYPPICPGGDSPQYGIYDINGRLLESRIGGPPTCDLVTFSRTTYDICGVRIYGLYDTDGIDTLVFGSIVPEPGSLLLAAAGTLGVLRRRRPVASACTRRGRLDAYGLRRRPGVSASSTASVFLILLVLVGVGAARGQSRGPVVVSGYDPEEHGLFDGKVGRNVQGWLYIQDGLEFLASHVTNGNTVVVCLGCRGASQEAFESAFCRSELAATGWTSVIIRDDVDPPVNIPAFFGTGAGTTIDEAGIIYMPTEYRTIRPFGQGITESELSTVNANRDKILHFITGGGSPALSAGGGLFSHGHQCAANGFLSAGSWFKGLFPNLVVTQANPAACGEGMGTQLRLTCEGYEALLDLTDLRLQAPDPQGWHPWHAYFTTRPGHPEDFRSLKPLLRAYITTDPESPIETVIFGGILDGAFPEPTHFADCDQDNQYDACEILDGAHQDCNDDRVPDDCQSDAHLYVDADAPPGGDRTSWDRAYNDLQDALLAANGPNTLPLCSLIQQIWVADGTYKPWDGICPPGPREATFRLVDGVGLYGGFAGNETSLEQRAPATHVTVLSGDLGTSGRSYHILAVPHQPFGPSSLVVVDGFTIAGGNADVAIEGNRGAGLYDDCTAYCGPLGVSNCVFRDHYAEDGGGGVYVCGSPATLTNCVFDSNKAGACGGGLLSEWGVTLTDCSFTGNSAAIGGAVCLHYAIASPIRSCAFLGNTASDGGGAVAHDSWGPLDIANSLFSGNSCATGNGGAICSGYAVNLADCTFAANSAGSGGALYDTHYADQSTVSNCIFWADTATTGPEMYLAGNHLTVVSYSDVQNGQGGISLNNGATLTWGPCNIALDPLFADLDGADNNSAT